MRSNGGTPAPTPTEVGAVAVQLPADLRIASLAPADANVHALQPLEALVVAGESAERRQQFAAGRHCAHTVMAPLQAKRVPLLRHRSGAPDWPRTVRGSISHKSELCVAVAGAAETLAGIGIDVENSRALPAPVWARVFTTAERRHLEVLPPAARAIRARLCFSTKECYYKWYRSQGGLREPNFDEVEVDVVGTALHVHPIPASDLPAVHGCFAEGSDWLITVLWSYVTPTDHGHTVSTHNKNSLEVDHHGYTHRSTVHA